jgi:cytochrome c peroxidase
MPANRLPGVSQSPDGKRVALAAGRNNTMVYSLAGAGEDRLEVPLGLDALIPAPESNPLSREKAALGKKLFFDKRLSRDGTVACASCHDPAHAFADLRPRALGVNGQQADRRSPRIANRAWGRSFFWDGRAATLEDQVLQPIANPKEMALDPQEAADRAGLPLPELRDALATYVRTILAGDSLYDRYMAGRQDALTPAQHEGLRLFRGKGRCASCHAGPNLTDELLHETGIGTGKFKTPSLRDVARTPPFMHDGSLATLSDVVRHYNRGAGEVPALGLTESEEAALTSFLAALNGVIRDGY